MSEEIDLKSLSVRELTQLWYSGDPDQRELVQVNGRFADVKVGGKNSKTYRWEKAALITACELDRTPNDCIEEVELDLPEPAKPFVPKEPTPPAPCSCGCGETVRGKSSKFIPGHDARFYGLIKRIIEGRLHRDEANAQVKAAILAGVVGHGVFRPRTICYRAGEIPFTEKEQIDWESLVTKKELKEAGVK